MKIFSRPEHTTPKSSAGPKKSGKNKMQPAPSEKAAISEGQIREKLAAHVESSNSAKSQLIKKNNQALGSGFMNSEVKAQIPIPAAAPATPTASGEEAPVANKSLKESHLLMSDVQLNDPQDSNTQEKLKSVLRNGAFSFNPKEKETLERILGGS